MLLMYYDYMRCDYCYLIVQRKTSYGYYELMTSKYNFDEDTIYSLYSDLTPREQTMIRTRSYEDNLKYLNSSKVILENKLRLEQIQKKIFLPHINNHKSTLWEIPKGTPKNDKEHPIDTSVRELKEETGINRNQYQFIGFPTSVYRFDETQKYKITYYLGVSKKKYNTKIKKNTEIYRCGWFFKDEIFQLRGGDEILTVIEGIHSSSS